MTTTAAILDSNSLVINIIMADPADVPGSVNGAGGAIGDTWDGGRFLRPDPPPIPEPLVPEAVMRGQAVRALRLHPDPNVPERTCLETVQALRDGIPDANMRADLDDALTHVVSWRRTSPTLAAMASAAGWTPEFVDGLFVAAESYDL